MEPEGKVFRQPSKVNLARDVAVKPTEEIDFLKDPVSEMTWGRRLALYWMQISACYNPRLRQRQEDEAETNDENAPSLARAWAFFEHNALNRYVVHEEDHKNNQNQQQDMAEPGESSLNTSLYHPWKTPLSQLGDFGLGYGLYFDALRSFAILFLIVGIINIPSIMYFASDEYSAGQDDVSATLLKGSAICTGTLIITS